MTKRGNTALSAAAWNSDKVPSADCFHGDSDSWYDSDSDIVRARAVSPPAGMAEPPTRLTAAPLRAAAALPRVAAPQGGGGLGKRRALDDAEPANSVHRRCA